MADDIETQSRPIVTLDDARAAGLKRYFTGKPCKRGHISERQVSNLTCMKCADEQHSAWRAENPEINRAQKALSSARNKKKNNDRCRKWRLENLDRERESGRLWRLENPERYRARRAVWCLRNLELYREYRKRWILKNPEKRRATVALYRDRKRGAGGSYTAADIARIFKLQKAKCAHSWCKASLKAGYEIDHIISIAKGGSNWPTNLQLLCQPCNRHKSDKHPIDFARENGLLL